VSSADTVQLYKHRLCIGQSDDRRFADKELDFGRNNIASFIAKEMVRYAESQAVFTLIVISSKNQNHGGEYSCIFMRLLGWDTKIATRETTVPGGQEELLTFNMFIKVIYVEKEDYVITSLESEITEYDWDWDKMDFCCPPSGITTIKDRTNKLMGNREDNPASMESKKKASVRIYLSFDESKELLDSLRLGSSFFPQIFNNWTLQYELGKQNVCNEKACISMLPFFD